MTGRTASYLFLFCALAATRVAAQDVTFTIDAVNERHVIPDVVYGVNDLGVAGSTVHRHGGNRHTGLNWENNASNAGSDYIHHSDSYLGSNAGIGSSQTSGALLQAWLNADRAAGLKTIITLPLAGYVAADMNGTVAQAETAPSARWKQIVADKPGPLSLTPDKNDGVVYLEEMVNFLIHHYGTAANGGVAAYSLDNEPALWFDTHPRIHPSKVGYQELVNRHVPAATITTALDPSAQIYGPVGYGWGEHLNLQEAPDAAGYNNTYGNFTNYYLAQMKSASDAAGRRLLHRYDIH
ncbi:MAG TPA: glycoside hydrolase family 44 protein, partial [Chthoniobacterales bacterium]